MDNFRKRLIAIGFSFLSTANAAIAADNNSLINFAKANANKFRSELATINNISIGSHVVLAGKIEGYWFESNSKYDDENGLLVIKGSPYDIDLSEVCKVRGKARGQNALGVKMTIALQDCNAFRVKDTYSDSWIKSQAENRIKVTPSQYRSLVNNGVHAEFDVIVGLFKGDYVVEFGVHHEQATIQNPVETRTNSWDTNVQFDRISFILPGSKEVASLVIAGAAKQSFGPSVGYGGRVSVRLKSNIVFPGEISGNPIATVEVRTSPGGTIVGRKLIKSSGVNAWDDTVLRAIDKTEVFPRDIDGRVPSLFEVRLGPKD